MRNKQKSRLIISCLGCLIAFALPLQAAVEAELSRASVVVVAQPEFSMEQIKSFSWSTEHANISNALKQSDFSVADLIDKAIIEALKKKSYAISSAGKNNLFIQYHVSLASEIDDTALLLKYGLSPGLRGGAHTQNHERGTLVIEFVDPILKKVVWRGAVEVFTGVEDTAQGRQKRVNRLLVDLFARIPELK